MASEDFRLLKEFLEERNVAVRAAKPLKDGTIFKMVITGDGEDYFVSRENKATRLNHGPLPKSPEITFTISPKAIKHLHAFDSDNIGAYGVEFFKLMVSDDPDIEIKAQLHVGVWGLTKMGVFKILALGGPEVMGFLAKKGLGSVKAIGRAVKKLSGKD